MIGIAVLATASLIALAGCSAGSSGGTTTAASKRACVILPDAASSNRWENGDRQALDAAFTAAGFKTDIQNAQGDTAKYATIAQQQLTKGCGVEILVDYNGAGIQVAKKAKAQGIPVIAYDRPIAGADYYVSFDNFHVGELEGQMIVDGLKAEGKDPATAKVVYVGGDPTDGNAKQFHDGADSIMSKAGIKPAFETQGTWDGAKAGTFFEQAYTALSGNIDAVWVANDTNAAAVITILDKNGKKVPVSGQDASPAGLQNVLLGKQTGTVYKPFKLEADKASSLAIDLLNGKKPTAPKKAADGTPFFAESPISTTAATVEQVVTDGNAKASDICTTAELQTLCAKYGVK
jgi:D-xylose transport system substrate-binding protein